MGGYDLVKSTLVKFAPGADPNGFGTKLLGGMGSGCVSLLHPSLHRAGPRLTSSSRKTGWSVLQSQIPQTWCVTPCSPLSSGCPPTLTRLVRLAAQGPIAVARREGHVAGSRGADLPVGGYQGVLSRARADDDSRGHPHGRAVGNLRPLQAPVRLRSLPSLHSTQPR